MAAHLRVIGLAGCQRPSAGCTVGAAKGRDTNPVPCRMFIAAAGGGARRNRLGDMTKVTSASPNGRKLVFEFGLIPTPGNRDL